MKTDEIQSSYKYCENLAVSHYENFPVGSLLIPKSKRKYVYSIYAFARTADDIADSSSLSSEIKLEKLDAISADLHKALNKQFEGISGLSKDFAPALYDTVVKLEIPVIEFENLLTAFKQDAVKDRYEKFSELIDYSANSANPIGHLILYVFGYMQNKNEELFEYSGYICTALQLANFWQDVSVDLKINRIYIPNEIMRKYGYNENKLLSGDENEEFKFIMRELVSHTRELFYKGMKLPGLVKGRLSFELKATILGGMEILNKIEKINYKVLSQRVKLEKNDKIKLLIKTLF